MPRLRWPLLAAASLLLLPPRPVSVETVRRARLIPDSTFQLPDSVRAVLTRVSRLAVAPDSSLYLSDWRLPAILHLGSSGEYRRALGRRGSGPGEFNQILFFGLYRDSLWAMDLGHVRVTLFAQHGAGVHTLPFGPNVPRSSKPGAYSVRGVPVSVLPDGQFLLEEATPDPTRPTHGLLLRVDRTMRVLDTVAELSAEHRGMTFEWQGGGASMMQPFSDDPAYAVSSNGSFIALVNRRVATSADEAAVTVVGLRNGSEVAFRQTIRYKPRRLTNRLVDSMATLLAGDRPSPDMRWPMTVDSVRRKLFRPTFMPPVAEVSVGRDQSVWLKVQFADGPATGDEWLQLSPQGQPLRRVATPTGFRLLEADHQMVWAGLTDSLDVPEVRRYTVE